LSRESEVVMDDGRAASKSGAQQARVTLTSRSRTRSRPCEGNVTLHPTDMLSDIFTTKGG